MQTATQAEQTNVIDPDDIDNTDAELIEQIKSEGVKRAQDCIDVCCLMMTGESTAQSCRHVGIPDSTFHLQVFRSQTLAERYARARKILIDVRVDRMLQQPDKSEFIGDDGRVDNGAVQLYKAFIDNEKWVFSKLDPKRFGDKLELYGDQANPIMVTAIERRVVDHRPERQALPVDADVESSEQSTEQDDAQ